MAAGKLAPDPSCRFWQPDEAAALMAPGPRAGILNIDRELNISLMGSGACYPEVKSPTDPEYTRT